MLWGLNSDESTSKLHKYKIKIKKKLKNQNTLEGKKSTSGTLPFGNSEMIRLLVLPDKGNCFLEEGKNRLSLD